LRGRRVQWAPLLFVYTGFSSCLYSCTLGDCIISHYSILKAQECTCCWLTTVCVHEIQIMQFALVN
jgi:hypothetical protein